MDATTPRSRLSHLLETAPLAKKQRLILQNDITEEYLVEFLDVIDALEVSYHTLSRLVALTYTLSKYNLPKEYLNICVNNISYIDCHLIKYLHETDPTTLLDLLITKTLRPYDSSTLYSDYYSWKTYGKITGFENLKILAESIGLTQADYNNLVYYINSLVSYFHFVYMLVAHKDEVFLNTLNLNLSIQEFRDFITAYSKNCNLEPVDSTNLFLQTDAYNEALEYCKAYQ